MAQDLSTASRRAAQQAQLDALDGIGSSRDDFSTVVSAIEMVAYDFVQRVQANIQNEKMIVSGSIANLSITADGDTVNVFGTQHLIYQDKGVNGSKIKKYSTPFSYRDKRPPMDIFLEYVRTKNLQLRNEPKYRKDKGGASPFAAVTEADKQTQLAYAIREKIFREGFKPRNIYSREIPQLIKDLQAEIPNFAAEQVRQAIGSMPPQTITINL